MTILTWQGNFVWGVCEYASRRIYLENLSKPVIRNYLQLFNANWCTYPERRNEFWTNQQRSHHFQPFSQFLPVQYYSTTNYDIDECFYDRHYIIVGSWCSSLRCVGVCCVRCRLFTHPSSRSTVCTQTAGKYEAGKPQFNCARRSTNENSLQITIWLLERVLFAINELKAHGCVNDVLPLIIKSRSHSTRSNYM